ncbi:MAG: bifunctional phosphopantothenoylcysteine decarboxylase/phosphopantothenate--cysteine ligase CoaBC [Ruaniaceae bacterium]|nr:bifunctional phosphopantothenoylcysteine decarboxylase/phosphopantothenate--cysteine ligase CoaBC [Ruaniaceae bacterium]
MLVLLGVSGGIAAYKAVHIARGLLIAGHDVRVIPTRGALTMVGAATWEGITGHPVSDGVFDEPSVHVQLGRAADLFIVAPATAHTLARLAHGLADDLLTSTALMANCPVLVAPAMHTQMWQNAATQSNVALLRERGVHVIGPDAGPLAGGDSGLGRMSEPDDVLARALELLAPAPLDLAGVRVLITAGGTREPLDPVRYLSNRSSGRQGFALAAAAARRGAEVIVVAGSVDVSGQVETVHVETALEMREQVMSRAPESDVIIMSAAVADYRAAQTTAHKMKKQDSLTLELTRNPDILRELVERRREGQIIVGFAAETGDESKTAAEHAAEKARRKGADLLAFNVVSTTEGFGDVPNTVTLLDAQGRAVGHANGTKTEVAEAILDEIVRMR